VAHTSDPKPDLSSLTAEELILRLQGSPMEEASLYCEELILRFEPLLRHAWHKGGGGGEYQDFVQDVFVRLFSGLHQLRNPKAFPGYFRSVALNVAAHHWRQHWSALKKSQGDVEKLVAHADESLLTRIVVRSNLERLPAREQEVIRLYFLEDLTTDEIANLLRIEAGAVRATKSRALKKLRTLLMEETMALKKYSPSR